MDTTIVAFSTSSAAAISDTLRLNFLFTTIVLFFLGFSFAVYIFKR